MVKNYFSVLYRLQGTQTAKTKPYEGCCLFKKGESYNRNDAERLFRHLVLQKVLAEELKIGMHDNVISYLKCGPRANEVLNNSTQVGYLIYWKHKQFFQMKKSQFEYSSYFLLSLISLKHFHYFTICLVFNWLSCGESLHT